MTQISIYDMDQTITRQPTFTYWLLYWAVRRAPWRLPLFLVTLVGVALFLLRLFDRKRLKEFNLRLLMGSHVPQRRLQPVVERHAEHVMRTNLHQDALAQISADREAGRRVVMATASQDFYVGAIADRLGIADVIATATARDAKGRLLPRVVGENCYDTGKLHLIQAWLAEHGLAREDTHVRFYSDHISDIPTFDWVDEPVVVNPSPIFAALAKKRGWRVARWT